MSNLVQAILLPPDAKSWPASTVVRTVAMSSVHALRQRPQQSANKQRAWASWLSGSFTKSVRVAKSRADFSQALIECAAMGQTADFRALAFSPMSYEDMPRYLSRARVSGLNCEDDLPREPSETADWNLAVVTDMSTGKMGAQVSHALMLTHLEEPDKFRSFHVYRSDEVPEHQLSVTDSGLTEFDRPTLTVVAHR